MNDRLDADLRALGAAVRPSAGFADRVVERVAAAPAPRRRRFRPALVAGLALVASVGAYLAARPRPALEPNPPGEIAANPAEPPPVVGFSLSDLAYVNSRWGFIDRTGTVVIPTRYTEVGEFSAGRAAVQVGGQYRVGGGRWGYVDAAGMEAIAPRYEEARPFRDGLAAVKAAGKWGFIDRAGTVVIPPRFEAVGAFAGGLAAVQQNGLWGYVGRDGAYRITPRFVWAGPFAEGVASVQDPPAKEGEPGRLRYVDTAGTTAIELPADCEYAGPFAEERAAVRRGELYGAIDHTGRFVIEPRYGSFESFAGGRAWVAYRRRVKVGSHAGATVVRHGFIAADGTELGPFPPAYDNGVEIDPATGSLSALEVDEAGRVERVTRIDFDRLRPQEQLYRVYATHRFGKVMYHTVGFVDRTGRVVIRPTLEDVGDFREGLAPVAVGLDWEAVAAMERNGR